MKRLFARRRINVWTAEWPLTEARRPVLLRIPGGGNINGGTAETRYDGHAIARRGVVVVTVNYRLGSFGFFSHPSLTAESPWRVSGNQGLLDQVAALEWVQANIARLAATRLRSRSPAAPLAQSISPR
jgi:para-nitrobenzyl esterase